MNIIELNKWPLFCPVTSMLETKSVSDNFKMLLTVLAFLVNNLHYLFTLASGTNIQKMSPTSKFSHQHSQIFTNFKSPTYNDATNIIVHHFRLNTGQKFYPKYFIMPSACAVMLFRAQTVLDVSFYFYHRCSRLWEEESKSSDHSSFAWSMAPSIDHPRFRHDLEWYIMNDLWWFSIIICFDQVW